MNQFLRRIQHSGFVLPSALLGYLWLKGQQPSMPGLTCLMRHWTGIPCPTCYLTRATCSALAGNLGDSVQYHLFGPLAAVAIIIWAGLSLNQKQLIPKVVTKPLIKIIAASMLAYWLLRVIGSYWITELAFLKFPT